MSNTRSRGWCFTINNPTGWDDVDLEKLQNETIYLVYGKEKGTQEQTVHYQGFCRFAHPVTFKRIKDILPRAHIEAQKGSCQQAADYCKKDGDFLEYGELPTKRNSKEMWKWVIEQAEKGNIEAIKDEYPAIYFRYLERIKSIRLRRGGVMPGPLLHEWWVGPTGTGKSRTLWRLYPDHYAKELNKWWDGYQDEDVVAIEEWCPKNECTASFLKIWADRYPFPAQIKGGSLKKIRPKKIIVLSNYTIDQCFPNSEDHEPIKRRFKVIHFPTSIFPEEEEETKEDDETEWSSPCFLNFL